MLRCKCLISNDGLSLISLARMNEEYQLNHSHDYLGNGFIIVNGFDHSPRKRTGMEAEIKLLRQIFTSLGLKTEIYRDLTAEGFRSLIKGIREKCVPVKDSMVAMAISSHGFNHIIEFMPENWQKSAIGVENNKNEVFVGEASATNEPAKGMKNKYKYSHIIFGQFLIFSPIYQMI